MSLKRLLLRQRIFEEVDVQLVARQQEAKSMKFILDVNHGVALFFEN
jgi:hypothetical protein